MKQSHSQATLCEAVPFPATLSVKQSHSQATLSEAVLFPGYSLSEAVPFQDYSLIEAVPFPGYSLAFFFCLAKAEEDPGNEATVKYVG